MVMERFYIFPISTICQDNQNARDAKQVLILLFISMYSYIYILFPPPRDPVSKYCFPTITPLYFVPWCVNINVMSGGCRAYYSGGAVF